MEVTAPMTIPRGLDALLRLEDAPPDVLFAETPVSRVRIWPLFRTFLAFELARDELDTGIARPGPGRPIARRALDQARSMRHSRELRGHRDVLIVSSGATVRPTDDGIENWLENPLALAVDGSAAIVQDRPLPEGFRSGPRIAETFSYDDALFQADLRTRLGRLDRRDVDVVTDLVDTVIDRLDYPLPPHVRDTQLPDLLYRVNRAQHTRARFERLLDRVTPRVILMETAAYGGRSASLRAAVERGIPVIEPQHGWIGPAHGAYNFGAAMSGDVLRPSLPSALLTFGDYWAENLRFPGPLPVIGKPYLEQAVRDAAAHPSGHSGAVLVVSSVLNREQITRISLRLRSLLEPERPVVFRPHPSERARFAEYYPGLVDVAGIEIDHEPDLYRSFGRSAAVVGYASTVLYEALAFGIPVSVIDSKLADHYAPVAVFGARIDEGESLDELAATIREGRPRAADVDLERIWRPNAVENFRAFLGPYL
jgi:hypothetical protein